MPWRSTNPNTFNEDQVRSANVEVARMHEFFASADRPSSSQSVLGRVSLSPVIEAVEFVVNEAPQHPNNSN